MLVDASPPPFAERSRSTAVRTSLDSGHGLSWLVGLALAPAILVTAAPGIGFTSRTGDVVLDTLSAAATVIAAAVAVVRFNAAPSRANQVLVFALTFQTAAALSLLTPALVGVSRGSPLDGARAVSLLCGTALLAWAAFARSDPVRASTTPRQLTLLAASASLLGGGIGAVWPGFAFDRGAAGVAHIGHLSAWSGSDLLIQVSAILLLAIATDGFALRVARFAGCPFVWWLALSSALASWGMLDHLLFVRHSTSRVSLDQLLRLGSALALAAGAIGELNNTRQRERELAVQEERERLARELHDNVAQELAYIVGQSRRLARMFPEERALAEIGSAAEHALADSRSTIYGLRTAMPRNLGHAIAARARELATRAGLTLTLDLAEDLISTAEIEHEILAIVQEAISNTARHAAATIVRISLSIRGGGLVLRISDDGHGFDPGSNGASAPVGFGLESMAERARGLGGELRIESVPGAGTAIELALS